MNHSHAYFAITSVVILFIFCRFCFVYMFVRVFVLIQTLFSQGWYELFELLEEKHQTFSV